MFAYCENDPVNQEDSSGMMMVCVCEYGGGGGGGKSYSPPPKNPVWATNIQNGRGSEKDYRQAINCHGKELPEQVNKAIEIAHEHYRKIGRTGVHGLALSAVGGLGAVGQIQVAYVWDKFGNKAVLITPGWGGGAGANVRINPCGLGGSSLSFSDAVVVWDLAGAGASLGGTVGAVGGELLQSVSPSSTVHGHAVGVGAGLEFHCTMTYSWVVPLN